MPAFPNQKGTGLKSRAIAVLDKLLTIERVAVYLHFWARLVVLVRKPVIIGITGTVGKTTAIEMIASVLKQPEVESLIGEVGCAENNMNDDLGLPATLLQFIDLKDEYPPSRLRTACLAPFRALRIIAGIDPYPKVFVLEFGAGWGGHIARLAQLARPDIAVVTTIGAGHLERLKTLEGVALEKMALVKAVPPSGLVILGKGHDFVAQFTKAAQSQVILADGKGMEFGENAARAICQRLQIPDAVVDAGLRAFKPPKGRLNLIKLNGLTVIDDSYNANPLSMKYGLDVLSKAAETGSRRVAVLGFMAELGSEGLQYHKEIGAYARSRADLLIGVGELAKHYDADHWFESSEECAECVTSLLRPRDCVLVKGSSSARTRKIVEKLGGFSQGMGG